MQTHSVVKLGKIKAKGTLWRPSPEKMLISRTKQFTVLQKAGSVGDALMSK